MHHNLFHKILLLLLTLLLSGLTSFAGADELEQLGFTDKSDEQPVATSRILRPTSKIAENVTVITAADISRLNAHTLADVLQTIPGIQLDHQRTPSSWTLFNIQGALNNAVLVLVDGIRQNDFNQDLAPPGLIPVQQIERIEIIKGAASAAWGSALGGVVNIITKTPPLERGAGGMLSASIGSKFTSDSRTELSSTVERLGYYLTAGNLHSKGLTPNGRANQNNLYSKFSYLLPDNGIATFGLSHLSSKPGLDEGDTPKWGFVHDNNEHRHNSGFLSFLNQSPQTSPWTWPAMPPTVTTKPS